MEKIINSGFMYSTIVVFFGSNAHSQEKSHEKKGKENQPKKLKVDQKYFVLNDSVCLCLFIYFFFRVFLFESQDEQNDVYKSLYRHLRTQ